MKVVGRARFRSARKVSSVSAKIDVRVAVDHGGALDPGALEDVRQRQVGHDAVLRQFADARLDVGRNAFAGPGDVLEAVHHALGLAGGARGVDHHRGVLRAAGRAPGHGLGARGDRVPGVVVGARRQREGDAGQACGHAGHLLLPGVELADEQQAGVAVLQHELHGLGRFRREDRHRGVAGHPDRQFGHEEVGAVLGQDGDAGAGLEIAALQVSGHAARLVQRLLPGVVRHFAAAQGLGQVDLVGLGGFEVVNVVEDEFAFCHGASCLVSASLAHRGQLCRTNPSSS